ncbi:MAG: ABC transporter ATP-binding protein [Ignavibacteria bacterium]
MNAVQFNNIVKRFGNYTAVDNISLNIINNTVHCILGENGAGKSTLMKVLFGIYQPDSGSLKVLDEVVNFKSPHDAIDKKIGMVHQHFMLIQDFTVLENVILGNEVSNGFKLSYADMYKTLQDLIEKYNLGLNLNSKISEISISEQQKVEILKLLFRSSEILIFDEPTAVLSPIEVTEFFNIIKKFKSDGKTIILITHKLNEVKEISDRVSVLRKGKLVFEADNNENDLNVSKLSNAIVGEILITNNIKKIAKTNNTDDTLSLRNIVLKKSGKNVLNKLNLSLKKGEIHGICGVEGNGQNEIVDIITGLEMEFRGDLKTDVKDISLVPDDRIKKGMIKEFSVGENAILKRSSRKLVNKEMLENISVQIIKDYDVRVSDVNSPLESLSGGNQQKVIVAREMNADNEILIFSHPTRGVDINATLFIHNKIIEQRNNDKAVLLISSDLDELLSLSDRLSVLFNGQIIKTYNANDLNPFEGDHVLAEINTTSNRALYDELGKLMIGIQSE